MQLIIQTADRDLVASWLDPMLPMSGIEGVVAKLDEAYPNPDSKRWRKVRCVNTMELTVHGFIPEANGSLRLVLAHSNDDDLRIVGAT